MLSINPTLTSSSNSPATVAVSWGLAQADNITSYTTFTVEIRWDPKIATVSMSSIKLIGSAASGDVTLFDTTQVVNGILKIAGFSGLSDSFSGTSPLVSFSYSQATLAPVTFSVDQELINGNSLLSSTLANNEYVVNLGNATLPGAVLPQITGFAPAQGSTISTLNGNITLTFNEAVQPVANSTASISVYAGSLSATPVTLPIQGSGVNFSNQTLTITPTANLLAGTTYYVVIPNGAIQDIAGDVYGGENTYSFTTAANASNSGGSGSGGGTTTVSTVGFAPALGATVSNLSTPIVVTFNEAVKLGPGYITIHSGSATGTVVASYSFLSTSNVSVSGSNVTITPSSALSAGTTYYVVFDPSSVLDNAGNAYAGSNTYEFQTSGSSNSGAGSNGGGSSNSGGTGSSSTLTPLASGQLLSSTQLNVLMPELQNPASASQNALGNLLVLSGGTSNNTIVTKIISDGSDPLSGTLTDAGMNLTLNANAGVSLSMISSKALSSASVANSLVTNYINQSVTSNPSLKSTLLGDLSTLTQQVGSNAVSAAKVISISGSTGLPATINLQENNQQSDLIALNVNALQSAPNVNIGGVKYLMVSGAATVVSNSTASVSFVGDTGNQTLVGSPGGGNFLSGGGGNDTLTGNGNANTFYLSGSGHLTINDFNASDVIKLNMMGVHTINDLVTHITNLTDTNSGITVTFDNSLLVTLLGVHSGFVFTPSMFSF